MLIARTGPGPRTERTRPLAGPAAAGRGWVDPASAQPSAHPRPAAGPVAAGRLAGLDALLALQQVEDAGERRRRATRQGAALLDGLAELHLGLLAGELKAATLRGLRQGLARLDRTADEPRLRAVLTEIAVRVEVELAKLERAEAEGGARALGSDRSAAGAAQRSTTAGPADGPAGAASPAAEPSASSAERSSRSNSSRS